MGKKAKKAKQAGAKAKPPKTKAEIKKGKVASPVLVAEPGLPPARQESSPVDFWFDPRCPWAWLTSRWMLEVETVRPVKTFFHVMSLAVLDEHKEMSEDARDSQNQGWAPVRVALGVGQHYGQEQLASFYTALGTRIHVRDEGLGRETLLGALADCGLPPDLVERGYTGDHDDLLRRSTWEGMNLVGLDVGTPVISVNGYAFFGPIFTPRPTGEEAGRVWDGVLALASYPGFYELKRTRDDGPIFD
jgi:hypothetical protein